MPDQIEWSNQIGSRSRRAYLLIVDSAGKMHEFAESIPGVVAVVSSDYTKKGKWSHSTYQLKVAAGVRAIPWRMGWETNTVREGLEDATRGDCSRWHLTANTLGVTVLELMEFSRANWPSQAGRWDKVEDDLAAVEEACNDDVNIVTVSFGGPTNRRVSEGFWTWPVIVRDATGQIVDLVEPDTEPDARYPVSEYLSNDERVRVLEVVRGDGHHGGYTSIRLAVPDGCTAAHEQV